MKWRIYLERGRGSGMDFFEIAKWDAYEAAMKARNRPALGDDIRVSKNESLR